MAELALGGLYVEVKRTRPGSCQHEQTLSTVTSGLQRKVCESCGHISIRYIRPLSTPVDRRIFAREADLVAEMMESSDEKIAAEIAGFSLGEGLSSTTR